MLLDVEKLRATFKQRSNTFEFRRSDASTVSWREVWAAGGEALRQFTKDNDFSTWLEWLGVSHISAPKAKALAFHIPGCMQTQGCASELRTRSTSKILQCYAIF